MTDATKKTLFIGALLLWWFWPEDAQAAEPMQAQIIPEGGFQVQSASLSATPQYECRPPA